MGWSTSNLSGAGVSAAIGGAFYGTGQTFAADTVKAALYNNTPTPNKDDTLANNTYLAGQWVTANEITGTGYTAGGATLASKANSEAAGVVTVTAANPSWTGATLANVYGALVYDSTLATKYAYCWNYFGGAQSVTGGTFTVAWNAAGIFTVTIS